MGNEQNPINWQEFFAKVVAVALIAISFSLLLVFLSYCFIYFPTKTVNDSLVNMGLLGDFFGGILGVIISLATLGATIYLALIVHKIERESSDKAIEGQRKVVELQLRFNELSTFATTFELEMDKIDVFSPGWISIDEHIGALNREISRIKILFPDIKYKMRREILALEDAIFIFQELVHDHNINLDETDKNQYIRDDWEELDISVRNVSTAYFVLFRSLTQWVNE